LSGANNILSLVKPYVPGPSVDESKPATAVEQGDPSREGVAHREGAVRALCDAWRSTVENWVIAMGGRGADCGALANDVLLSVYQCQSDSSSEDFAGVLYQMTRRRVRRARRALWLRRLLAEAGATEEASAEPDHDANPALDAESMLERLLTCLSESERTAILLFEIDGSSPEQIAHVQGVATEISLRRIRSGRIKLNSALRALGSHDGAARSDG
jgi:DNA-directed RNA polymerase specialized sigma24 family protein